MVNSSMLVGKLISSAVRLWLRSQASEVSDLHLEIGGNNKQILQGDIPKICINAVNTVYRDLHISELEITGKDIKFNLPQVLKRKPLKLVEPVAVDIKLLLSANDLEESLKSELLSFGLSDLWCRLSAEKIEADLFQYQYYDWKDISLVDSGISFSGYSNYPDSETVEIEVSTKIDILEPNCPLFTPIEIVLTPELISPSLKPIAWDLGKETAIYKLDITPEGLLLQGTITVFP